MKDLQIKPKIGIVSGIGPLAGSDVLAKLFKYVAVTYGAVEDSEYPDVVLVNHGITGVDNTGLLNDNFGTEVASMVRQLEAHGANIIGIACNTAHVYLHKIQGQPGSLLVNLIDAAALATAQSNHRYLLLTSYASKQQKLYHSYLDTHGAAFQETTSQQQKLLDEAIGLIMAHKLDQAGKRLEKVMLMAKTAGFSAVIAGCTELPIALAHCKNLHGLAVVDSNYILAKTLVDSYFEKI